MTQKQRKAAKPKYLETPQRPSTAPAGGRGTSPRVPMHTLAADKGFEEMEPAFAVDFVVPAPSEAVKLIEKLLEPFAPTAAQQRLKNKAPSKGYGTDEYEPPVAPLVKRDDPPAPVVVGGPSTYTQSASALPAVPRNKRLNKTVSGHYGGEYSPQQGETPPKPQPEPDFKLESLPKATIPTVDELDPCPYSPLTQEAAGHYAPKVYNPKHDTSKIEELAAKKKEEAALIPPPPGTVFKRLPVVARTKDAWEEPQLGGGDADEVQSTVL